jgi:hypothetical protein
MSEDNKEPWRELCEQASKEQDPEELMRLTKEIIRLKEPKPRQGPPSNDLGGEGDGLIWK